MNQESSEIKLVYVCVCEGDVGRLGCGFVLLYFIFYMLYFYILPSISVSHPSGQKVDPSAAGGCFGDVLGDTFQHFLYEKTHFPENQKS